MTIWQTKKWGEMLLASGQAESIFDVKGLQIEKRKVGMGEYGLFIIGIEMCDLDNEKAIKKLVNLCKEEKALFLQVEPLKYTPCFINFQSDYLKRGVFKKFIMPYTAVIDLEQSEDKILKNMKPKGRYNIRLAEKKGVEVRQVQKSEKNIKEFYNLMKETTSRDHFSGNSLNYYTTFLDKIESSELLLVYSDDKVIAGGIFIFDKKISIYYYGASTSDPKYRNLMAPYLLQWEAIKTAKEKGSKLYDFLGVATPGDNNTSLAGVTNFKEKLTKDIRQVSTSYIWVNKKCKYFILKMLRKIKSVL